MDVAGVDDMVAADQELDKIHSHDEVSPDQKPLLMNLDMDLAFSFKKLLNLNIFLIHMLTGKSYNRTAMVNNFISLDSSEKALAFDYLSGIIDCEVRELQDVVETLQTEVFDARQKKIPSSDKELLSVAEEKLHDCKEYLKQSQENALKLKMQSDKLHMALSASQHENCVEYSENGEVSRVNTNSGMQISKQQRHILRMLEESLARELDLEKKISELKQNEEELQLKLHLTEQVALCMEEATEVVWGRFLEAENASEVLMGISKELVGELQIHQFNLNCSMQREGELNSRLHDCIEQLQASQAAVPKLESASIDPIVNLRASLREPEDFHTIDNTVEFDLREKVKSLEEQLKESGLLLESANASSKLNLRQLHEAEHEIVSLKEGMSKAQSRAERAEARISVLTETNLELTEELGFLKGSDNNADKVSLLEKRSRDLEIQLQQTKASSEASQKQQIMLYSAILDMETLIGDLKSKVSIAESKMEAAEEKCNVLSDTNSKLNEEVGFLRDRMGSLEMSFRHAKDAKVARAKDINVRTKLMMDMVTQLTFERGLIQNKLHSFVMQNKHLVEQLQETKKDASRIIHENRVCDTKEFLFSNQDFENC